MRMSKSAVAAAKSRDKTIGGLKAELKDAAAALRKERRDSKKKDEQIRKKDEQIRKKDEQIRQLRGDKRRLAADCRARDAEVGKLKRLAGRQAATIEKQKEEKSEMGRRISDLGRRLRQYEGPHVPASKTRQRRNEDRKKGKEDGSGGAGKGGGGKGGGPRRKPGGQPGRRAARREFPPDRRVVIKKPDSCGKDDCKGPVRVDGYGKQIVHDLPPPRRPLTIEAQCPIWGCKCGDSGIATAGTAVPLHLFRPEKGDAEPDRPAGSDAAADAAPAPPARRGEEKEGGSGRQERQRQENGEAVEAIRAATGGGDIDVGAPVNDFPKDPSESFQIRLPLKGLFGSNSKAAVVKDWLNRITIRKIRESLRDGGVEMSEGQTSNVIRDTGRALQPALLALIALLACARVIHADKTSYRVDGEVWGLWVFFDPLRKIVVYWLSPDGDNAVLERILAAWKGIIVCDGAQVFRKYVIQRCWAHILTEAKYLARNFPDSKGALHVSDRLHKIFRDAKAYKGTHAERVRKRYEFTRRVRAIVDAYRDDPVLAEFMTKLDNAAFDLFLFVVESWVPPTNNPAEKLLREPVITRKIRGGLRAVAGAMGFCALLSCKTTWEMHGLRPLAEIRRVL